MTLSDAKKRANTKWNKNNLDRIQIVVRKGGKKVIKELAKTNGESLNAYILNAIKLRAKNESNIDIF